MKQFTVVTLLLLTAGCASSPRIYRSVPEHAPADQVARITNYEVPYHWLPDAGGVSFITCIDGHWGGWHEAIVSPGLHYVGITWRFEYGAQVKVVQTADSALWFNALGGRTYVARMQRSKGTSVAAWIYDETTGEHVGGIPGGEPNPAGVGERCLAGDYSPEQIAAMKKQEMEKQLRTLEKTRNKGLLSEAEYQRRRKALLDSSAGAEAPEKE